MTELKRSLLFLDKNRIDLFVEGGTSIFHIELSPQSVSDLEIVNTDNLKQEITTFLQSNAIPPSHALIILSDSLLFQKDFPPRTKEEDPDPEVLVKNFVENIPFTDTVSKTVDLDNGIKRVIAANKDFYTTIQSIFEKNKFTIQSVVLSIEIPGFQTNSLTSESINAAFKHFDSFKTGSFDDAKKHEKKNSETQEETMDEIPEENNNDQKKKEKQRQLLLLGVLGILILVLIGISVKTFVLDGNQTPPQPISQTQQNQQNTVPQLATEPTSQPTLQITPSVELIQNTSVQILSKSLTQNQANILAANLRSAGFENVTLETSSQTALSNTVIFSSELADEIKTFVTQEIQKQFQNITVREATGTSFDVVITIVNQE